MISAAIITLNEESNIGDCIESVRALCDDIVVLDSGSSDRTREIAIARMKRALGEFMIRGIKTTIPFQLEIINHPDFVAGKYDIGWVSRFLEEKKG